MVTIKVKRIYEEPKKSDGVRILVDVGFGHAV